MAADRLGRVCRRHRHSDLVAAVTYGEKPEGMNEADWLIECQCRHVARAMKAGRTRGERLAIYERWKKRLPGISKERVGEIWRQGVPMPDQRGSR